MPSVDIEGIGTVEFDDGMSQEDISSAIENDIIPRHQKGIDLRSQLESASSEIFPALNRAGLAVSEFRLLPGQGRRLSLEEAARANRAMMAPIGGFGVETAPMTPQEAEFARGQQEADTAMVSGMSEVQNLPLAAAAAIPGVGRPMGLYFGAQALGTGAGELVEGLKEKDPELSGRGASQLTLGAAMTGAGLFKTPPEAGGPDATIPKRSAEAVPVGETPADSGEVGARAPAEEKAAAPQEEVSKAPAEDVLGTLTADRKTFNDLAAQITELQKKGEILTPEGDFKPEIMENRRQSEAVKNKYGGNDPNVVTEEKATDFLKKAEPVKPQDDWKVVVSEPRGEDPGYVQVVDPRASEESGAIKLPEGSPDFLKLPTGNYSYGEAVAKLKQMGEAKPSEAAKAPVDPIESKLLDWIERTDPLKGGLLEGVTGAPVWLTKTVANTALRAGLAAYRTGKKLAVAIDAAVEHLRSLNIPGFKENEARAWVSEQLAEPSPIKTAIESAETGRKQIVTLWKSGKVKEAMAYTRDAADVKASVVGTQAANDVRGPIRRLFGKKDSPLAEDALSFVIESQRAPANLDTMANQILNSENASTKWRNRAIRAIEFAKANFEKLSRVADRYEQLTDRQLNQEERAGFDTPRRAGYVMHAQDLDTGLGFPDLAAGDGAPTAFRKQRTHARLSDSIAAGIDPKTLNAVDLLQSRVRAGQRMINRRAWVESLKDVSDPTNKLPIGTALEVVKKPDGSTQQQAPFGYHVESAGDQLIAVQNGYRGIFEALTDPSVFSHDAFGRALVKANQSGKSISLFFDTFHLGRIAYWESLIKAAGIKTFKLPVPSFKKGVTLLDYSIAEINRMAETGEIPKHWLNDLVQQKRKLDLAIKTGANFGGIADALHQEWIQKIPGIGKYNRWLFDQFQRGAMSEIWSLEFDRQRGMYKDLTDEQVARRVSKDVNTRFGNLGRQGWVKSQTGQDIARLLALAPQWNEGLISSEVGALRQLGETVVDAARGKRLASGLLLRSVGGMLVGQFVANQLINLYTRGHPTWENKEEGIGAKLSAWIPDKVGGGSGFFLHPAGLAAEITHLILKKYEQTGDFRKAVVDFTRSRASALTRPLWVLATAHDTIGRPLKPGDVIMDALKTAVPKPIPSSAVVGAVKQGITGQPSETFPGQYQKQMMASAGVKTDQVPSDEQRIRSLAKKFNAAKGITPSAEFYTGDYQNLSNALRIGNKAEAQKELQDLLKKKQPAVIFKHFSEQFRHPFTGQRARETEFLRTLRKEQADTYRKAVQERLALSKKAIDLLNANLGTGRSQQPNRDLEILRSMAR